MIASYWYHISLIIHIIDTMVIKTLTTMTRRQFRWLCCQNSELWWCCSMVRARGWYYVNLMMVLIMKIILVIMKDYSASDDLDDSSDDEGWPPSELKIICWKGVHTALDHHCLEPRYYMLYIDIICYISYILHIIYHI